MISKLQSVDSLPRILSFDAYKARHGIVLQDKVVKKEEQLNESRNFKISKITIIPFIGSMLLAIGASTTQVLDRFSEPVKKFIQSALTLTSLGLGTVTAMDFFKDPA